MEAFTLLVILVIPVSFNEGATILVWCPGGTKSVQITYMPVVERLVENGNNVIIVTPYPIKKKVAGITEILVDTKIQEIFDSYSV